MQLSLSHFPCTMVGHQLFTAGILSRKRSFCIKTHCTHTGASNGTGTAEGEGLGGPRPHHFFAPPPPLFALKRKIIKIKKDLKQVFSRLYSAIFSVFSLISNARHFWGSCAFRGNCALLPAPAEFFYLSDEMKKITSFFKPNEGE